MGIESGPLDVLATMAGRAIGSGIEDWLFPPSAPIAMSPGDQQQKADDYKNYKNICNQPQPPGMNKCDAAKWKKNRNQQCYNLRDQYAKKWFNGTYDAGHAQAMAELIKAMQNNDADIKKNCSCP